MHSGSITPSATLLILYPKYYDARAKATALEQVRQREEQLVQDRKARDIAKLREFEGARARAEGRAAKQRELADQAREAQGRKR